MLLKWDKNLAKCQDNSRKSPLHYLGSTTDTAIIDTILASDPDDPPVYCKDSDGWLPIHVAASRGRLDIIKKLVEEFPDCESYCNEKGETFLHVAVLNMQAKIVKHVCTYPKLAHLLNARDENGDTALHLAVKNGHEDIFCSLFGNKEICLSFPNKKGCTPLDIAFSSIKPGHVFSQVYISFCYLLACFYHLFKLIVIIAGRVHNVLMQRPNEEISLPKIKKLYAMHCSICIQKNYIYMHVSIDVRSRCYVCKYI